MKLTIIVRHMRRLLQWMNSKRLLDGLNTLRSPDGTKISLRSLVAVSRSTPRTPRVTCYARLEFPMSLLIASFRCGVGRMEWMAQPTIPRWIRQWLFLSLGLELAELGLELPWRPGNHRKDHRKVLLLESKTSLRLKAPTRYFGS